MFSPQQRGAMVLDQPGDPSCAHKGPEPCGKVPPGPPMTNYKPGQQAEIQFQQNLNHFYFEKPGRLIVQIAEGPNPSESDFSYFFGQAVADFNAMDEIFMANISVAGQMPPQPCTHCVLRLTYASNNPDENDTSTDFYQCADIAIVGSSVSDFLEQDELAIDVPSKENSFGDCCAPPQFEANFQTGSNFLPETGTGRYVYDSINKFVYVEVPTRGRAGTNQHWANFTSGIEWNYDPVSGQCEPYGLDLWNDWCYGTTQNELFDSSITIGNQVMNKYVHKAADFTWVATQPLDGCLPVMRSRSITGEVTIYSDVVDKISDPAIFVPNPTCHLHHGWKIAQSGSIDEIRAFAKTLPRGPLARSIAKKHQAQGQQVKVNKIKSKNM